MDEERTISIVDCMVDAPKWISIRDIVMDLKQRRIEGHKVLYAFYLAGGE